MALGFAAFLGTRYFCGPPAAKQFLSPLPMKEPKENGPFTFMVFEACRLD
jgi:hypothetical protein